MYSKDFKLYIERAWCCHLLYGGSHECDKHADKCWVFLEEGTDLRLEVILAIPVCSEHVNYMRAFFNAPKSYLAQDTWQLIDRESDSWSLVEKTLDEM